MVNKFLYYFPSHTILLLLVIGSISCKIAKDATINPPKLLTVKKIWDQAPHNAFTDLVYFQNRWFCVFREATSHVSADGAGSLRIISSPDGDAWESMALLTADDADLRDAKITVTPSGQLMLSGAGAWHDTSKHTHQSFVWFSDDGRSWSKRQAVADPDFWLWRTTWHQGKAYGFAYGCKKDNRAIRLYSGTEGQRFEQITVDMFQEVYSNETSIVFEKDTAYCLLRRDGAINSAMLGKSLPPYTHWEWKDLGIRIGGPHMIRLPDGRYVTAVRLYDGQVRTSLCWLDPKIGVLKEFMPLPSGGDTSYPGLVWRDDILWVSYYSSHEGKTSIYLAKVRL